jgi:hypothetical protein
MTALTTEPPVLDAPEPQPVEPTAPAQGWSFPARFGVRFALAFLIPLNIDAFLALLPYVGDYVYLAWSPIQNKVVSFLTMAFFRVGLSGRTGSGDSVYSYAQIVVYAGVALLIATVWSLLDRRRVAYPRMLEVLRVCVRVVLAEAMIGYGTAKIIPAQFPVPSLDKLVQPLGDFSPMGLLWAFMGFSPGYTIFTGAAELVAGILVTIRRTTLLGALMSIAVLVNVFALNMFYDVPVKVYSAQLLLLAAFLTLPHLHRLARFFVLNQPVPPDTSEPLVRNRWAQIAIVVARTLVVVWYVFFGLQESKSAQDFRGTRSPIRGVWNVATVTVDGVERPPLVTDLTRWRRLVFDYTGYMSLYPMDDRRQRFTIKLDEAKKTIALTSRDDPKRTALLTYDRKDANTLLVAGKLDGHDFRAICHRGDEHFFLTERGFHWISEKPVNR